MKKLLLLYLLLPISFCGCSNNSNNGQGQSGILTELFGGMNKKSPKDIQPEGTFVSEDNPLYKSLTFKGRKTVVIQDGIIGMDFVTEYDKDEEFLRVKTDKSDLLFEIITEDTLKGEGFADGLYIKN